MPIRPRPAEHAGHDAGHEDAHDRGVRHDGIEDHRDRGRDDHRQRRRRRHDRRRELLRVAAPLHRRDQDRAHGGDVGDGRARDLGEEHRGADGDHRQAAADEAEQRRLAKAISRRDRLDEFMIAPARMKSGIASSGKLVAPLYMTIAALSSASKPPDDAIAAIATTPSATAIGTLIRIRADQADEHQRDDHEVTWSAGPSRGRRCRLPRAWRSTSGRLQELGDDEEDGARPESPTGSGAVGIGQADHGVARRGRAAPGSRTRRASAKKAITQISPSQTAATRRRGRSELTRPGKPMCARFERCQRRRRSR